MKYFPTINLSWFLAWRTKLTLHCSQNPISFYTTSNSDDGIVTLPEIVRLATPKCFLNAFLFNGHLQTMWTTFDTFAPAISYKRKIFESESLPGTFAVDFSVRGEDLKNIELDGRDHSTQKLPPRTAPFTDIELHSFGSDDQKPMLIVLHGLGGGSNEAYVRRVIAPFLEGLKESWEVCVVNGRGCAKHKITTPFLYNARHTGDLRQCITWLRGNFPNRRIYALGLSLGANILANYLAEEGVNALVKAAVLCSNPWDLGACNEMLQGTWIGRIVYSPALGHSIKRLFEHNAEQISKNGKVDVEKVRREVKHLFEFDREVQVPSLGYTSYTAYYEDASSAKSVPSIRTPTLIITAEDDPIALMNAVPVQEIRRNPFLCLLTTSNGGHLGWFQWGGGRFFVTAIYQFLSKMVSGVDEIAEERHAPSVSSSIQGDVNAPQTVRKRLPPSLIK